MIYRVSKVACNTSWTVLLTGPVHAKVSEVVYKLLRYNINYSVRSSAFMLCIERSGALLQNTSVTHPHRSDFTTLPLPIAFVLLPIAYIFFKYLLEDSFGRVLEFYGEADVSV